MKTHFDGSADLMMNMVGAMVIMLAVFMPLAQLEQLTHMENQALEANGQEVSSADMETALVEVWLDRDGGKPLFKWQAHAQGQTTEFDDYAELHEALGNSRPSAIRLRMDRDVPSGVMQDIVVDASALGITILQSNRKAN
jgi:hypothetical protein